jgi:glutathione peroxidase-family protein
MSQFHELEMAAITGEAVSLSKYQDNLCLIVNVASR